MYDPSTMNPLLDPKVCVFAVGAIIIGILICLSLSGGKEKAETPEGPAELTPDEIRAYREFKAAAEERRQAETLTPDEIEEFRNLMRGQNR